MGGESLANLRVAQILMEIKKEIKEELTVPLKEHDDRIKKLEDLRIQDKIDHREFIERLAAGSTVMKDLQTGQAAIKQSVDDIKNAMLLSRILFGVLKFIRGSK